MLDKSIDLAPNGTLHKKLLDALNARFRLSYQRMSRLHSQWRKSEDQFLAYLPETELDSKRRVERESGGKPQYTTIVLPYTYAMLMSAHSYWTTVFLSRDPIFQFAGRHGESEQNCQALEALIGYQVQTGKMLVPLYFWLLDAGKYGLGVVTNYWDEDDRYVARNKQVPVIDPIFGTPMVDDAGEPVMESQLVREKVRGYHGNRAVNIRPYDYFPDPRVPLHDPQKGEFVGYLADVSYGDLIAGEQDGRYINTKYLKNKGLQDGRGNDSDFGSSREQGSSQVELPNDSSLILSDADLKNTGTYSCMTMYINLVPSQWGLGKSDYREMWVFTAKTSGTTGAGAAQSQALNLILGAQPLGNYSAKFPVHVLEMEPEAYAFAARGMPEIMRPLQNTIDWLLNSHMYNVRKTVNNQFLIDPSRVVMKDILDPQAGGMIRLKANAYGSDPKTAMAQLQLMDVTQRNIADISFIHDFAQRTIGVNDQIMGMVDSGGRKTAQEVRSSSSFGVNRMKTIAEFMSAMGFTTLSDELVASSQQYYGEGDNIPLKFRILGDQMQDTTQAFMMVKPEDIQGGYDFVSVDGTMPIDRFAQANLWKEILAGLPQLPQVAAQYDIGKIFAWTAKLGGLKNISQFKVQVLPQGAGPGPGLIPMPTGGDPRKGLPDLSRVGEPAQIPNMGTSG